MTKTNIILFLVITLLLISCSKEVYEFDNGLRKSKFILKNSKFKYIEESNAESFKSAGTFIRTDSTLIFNFKKSEKLPFSYATRETEIIPTNRKNNYQEITVVDTFDDFPEFSTKVILRDKQLKTIKVLETNFDGKVKINNPNEIFEIEIANETGSRKAIINYSSFRNNNILVKLKPIDFGGEPIDTPCLSVLIEPIIEFATIEESNQIVAIELNSIKYNRAK